MKNVILGLVLISFSALAQEAEVMKIDTFINQYGKDGIHEVLAVETIEKIEGNRICIDSGVTTCPENETFAADKITLMISGNGELNFDDTNNKTALEERTLKDDFDGSITELSFRGITEDEDGTLVYTERAWAGGGESTPFQFKIEIHNDGKKSVSKEFRIPTSNGGIYRFIVLYSDNKWSVETLAPLKFGAEVTGEFADLLFVALTEYGSNMSWTDGKLSCLKPKGLETPVCFRVSRETASSFSADASELIFNELNRSQGIFGDSYTVNIQCLKKDSGTLCYLKLVK